jgi:anti-sigma regulatory factor (Ser/Thr protein kinase)
VSSQIEDTLPLDPRAPGIARELVRGLGVDDATRRTLELIVSELVTNSVVHGDTAPEGELALRINSDTDGVRGEVCGPGPTFEWEQHEPNLTTPGGLGLMLVDNLAESWGITRNGDTCVWFECLSEKL